MTKVSLFVVLFVFFASSISYAQAIPLNGLSLRIVPTDPDSETVSPKTVNITQSEYNIRIAWYSLVKQLDEEAYYPTYIVKADRGMIETTDFAMKTAFFLPALWGNGYIRAETALPLWIDPEYLDLKGHLKRRFNLGIINVSKGLIKQAPDEIYEQINFFQNLYDQYVVNGELREDLNIRKSQLKELRTFSKEFFMVESIAKTKIEIYVNSTKTEYPARIIGNDYFQIVVIDDPLNPMVVNLNFDLKNIPKAFKESFKKFQKNFEFRVTQVSF